MAKLGILGVGKMGGSILNGVLASKLYKPSDIAIYTPNVEHQEKYQKMGIESLNSESELFNSASIILLAIKPQIYAEAFSKIDNNDFTNKGIISLAPGKSLEYLGTIFNNACIARIMPNTPALINSATTTIAFNNQDNNELKETIKKIVGSIGSYVEVEEWQIDEAIPLNGSMPAYLFAFIKEFIDNGVKHGLTYDEAKSLATSAIIGSTKLFIQSEDDIDTLINNVCSKGGTTIAGLNKLYDNGFKESIKECYDACVERSKELANNK